jgi:hypothetical protein
VTQAGIVSTDCDGGLTPPRGAHGGDTKASNALYPTGGAAVVQTCNCLLAQGHVAVLAEPFAPVSHSVLAWQSCAGPRLLRRGIRA